MESLIDKYLSEQCLVDRSMRLLVGVSGGPDSMCILNILIKLGYQVIAAHFNHKLRDSADHDARRVIDFVSNLGVEIISGDAPVREISKQKKISIEHTSRILRYQFLLDEANNLRAKAVVVGHNANDQVETVLLNLFRGTGIRGLAGMKPRKIQNEWGDTVPIIRPLLTVSRDQIMHYLGNNEIDYLEDSSNYDLTYTRNRIRHDILPRLTRINPRVDEAILRTSRILSEEEDLLVSYTNKVWEEMRYFKDEKFIGWEKEQFLGYSTGLQRRLLRRAIIYLIPNLYNVDFLSINRALNILSRQSAQCDLVGGMRFFVEEKHVWIAPKKDVLPNYIWPQISTPKANWNALNDGFDLMSGWKLFGSQTPLINANQLYLPNKGTEIYVDAEKLKFPLEIRGRLVGERFTPQGMEHGSIKVSDYMINLKIPLRARANWPIILSEGKILWIVGYQIGADFKVTKATSQLLHIKLSSRHEQL